MSPLGTIALLRTSGLLGAALLSALALAMSFPGRAFMVRLGEAMAGSLFQDLPASWLLLAPATLAALGVEAIPRLGLASFAAALVLLHAPGVTLQSTINWPRFIVHMAPAYTNPPLWQTTGLLLGATLCFFAYLWCVQHAREASIASRAGLAAEDLEAYHRRKLAFAGAVLGRAAGATAGSLALAAAIAAGLHGVAQDLSWQVAVLGLAGTAILAWTAYLALHAHTRRGAP